MMSTLKLSAIDDDKPVRLTVDLPAGLHRDLIAYGEAMGRAAGSGSVAPQKLVVPMLLRFITSDRGFASARRGQR
jgi:hypothetical protein